MWARASAGIVAGFFLSAALLGLITWSLPGPWQGTLVAGALAFFPLWMVIATVSFQFSSGRRAWLWLGSAALAGFGLLWALRALHWIA